MTVGELIEILSKLPKEAGIEAVDLSGGSYDIYTVLSDGEDVSIMIEPLG